METEAPNYSGNYPLAGERIGPAWRELWRRLDQKNWINAGDLASDVGPMFNIKPGTVKTLLRQAEAAGVLEQRLQIGAGRKVPSAHYRVSEAGALWTH